MARIVLPLTVETKVRSSRIALTIDTGTDVVTFAISSDPTEAKRQLALIATEAQVLIGELNFGDLTTEDYDDLSGLENWSAQRRENGIERG